MSPQCFTSIQKGQILMQFTNLTWRSITHDRGEKFFQTGSFGDCSVEHHAERSIGFCDEIQQKQVGDRKSS